MIYYSFHNKNAEIDAEALNDSCIKPMIDYHYTTCNVIKFRVNGKDFQIPAQFETDLANIPRIVWPYISPFHSSLIRAAIIHDYLYTKTCDFNRKDTDLIFYYMLIKDGISPLEALIMYYSVRLFGWNSYNEDFC